jgi:hypothetical protein
MTRTCLAIVLACAVIAGCSSGAAKKHGPTPPYTVTSVKTGFITTGDLGAGAIEVDDSGHSNHIVYTPPDSIPTCPYVQRADDVTADVSPALELAGGNSTGRFVVGPRDASQTPLPVVTEGALVFKTDVLADTGMDKVQAEAAKCPAAFTILGGPPVIVGDYKTNSRPFQLGEWQGFAQQLVHTFPSGVDPGTYDDLVTVVVRKANAIVYVGFEQTKQTGQRADSASKVKDAMKVALGRLG